MKISKRLPILLAANVLAASSAFPQAGADPGQKLAADFWEWRARTGQYTADDVTRMERQFGVVRDWSAAGVGRQRAQLTAFEERWRSQDDPRAPVAQQVDHRLIGSALARVRWELDILARWRRDPNFYIEQTLTPVGEALTVPAPYDEKHSKEILARLNDIPRILKQAEENLSSPPAPFARMAIDSLPDIRPEGIEQNRNRSVPPLAMAATTEEWVARHQSAELAVRDFLERRGILTLPPGLRHFTLQSVPPYLAALGDFVEMDDFTSPSRLDRNGIRYVAPPSPAAGYFWAADARDPRIQIVHEGTVGHYGQLCRSWENPDPIRRHYYDSGANEGIGFYAEEMMLQSGLYDDSPHSREIVYNQMRLRALRVIVDVKVALGALRPQQAAEFMQHNVPMSAQDARTEVVEMGETPGQKIAYQIGKLQIVEMMQDARSKQGGHFSVREFHDYVWLNGNVPFALQRLEYLGMSDEVNELRGLK